MSTGFDPCPNPGTVSPRDVNHWRLIYEDIGFRFESDDQITFRISRPGGVFILADGDLDLEVKPATMMFVDASTNLCALVLDGKPRVLPKGVRVVESFEGVPPSRPAPWRWSGIPEVPWHRAPIAHCREVPWLQRRRWW